MPIPKPLFLTGQNLAFDEASETVSARLTDHARTMEQGVYQVAEDFYVAVGYGNANMTMVVGSDSVILIDSMENAEAAREALADLRKVSSSDKPIKALIYTHSHPDHSSGSRGLLDPSDVESGHVEIYAHERLAAGMQGNPSLGIMSPLRLAYSFGWDLEPGAEGLVEVGLGPLLRDGTTGFLPPTSTFHGTLDIEVAGIRVHLREAPSEADDELVLWFPVQGVLHVADVIQGECLANLYALRGAVRDIRQWIGAVDLLRGFDAQALVFGHGRPLTGQDEVRELLTAYRDAMQYLHDQTVRLMARGLTPDELVEVVAELPPRLRDHPWLGEFYGTVKQTVRQIYYNAFGWFEGDPTFLDPLPRSQRSARYVAAMGGRDAVVATATQAHADGELRWTAEILTHLLRLDSDDQPARQLKADALRRLGYQASNPMWRNNYLMAAKELDGTLDHAGLLATMRSLANPDVAATMPIPLLLSAFATRLNPAHSDGIQLQVGLHGTDTDTSYGLAIRSEVAEVLAGAPFDATIDILATEPTLRGLLTGRIAWPRTVEDGAATLNRGTSEDAARFWSLFDLPVGELPALSLR
jgi:alkyl sulfatase BDS1-like metallo-beta-lactamase superfamily hydrolase